MIGVAVLGLLGVGVYVILATYGNQSDRQTAAETQQPSCELAVEKGKTLDQAAVGELAAFRGIEEPLDMSFITFKDSDGVNKTLEDWKGKVVLFNLWATWCPPCREEMPYFEELQKTRAGNRFDVVAVSIDLGSAEKPKAFYEQVGLTALPFYQDSTMEAFQQLREKGVALGMPTTLIVDENSCALGVLNGPAHWASDDALTLIDAALALNPG